MAKAIETYKGGINFLVEAAVRADGVVFMRFQDKTRWGYRWTKWTQKSKVDPENLPSTIPAGFANLYKNAGYGASKSLSNCRLPN